MPEYVYRREDGTTFNIKQTFKDDALTRDPQTGQKVVRVVQNTGVIFKGSGFYVNDSKKASKRNLNGKSSSNSDSSNNGSSENGSSSNESANNDLSGNNSSAASDTVKEKKDTAVTKSSVKDSKID